MAALMSPRGRIAALALAATAALSLPCAASATDAVWWGGSGNWSTAASWSLGAAPNLAGIDVFIDGGNPLASAVNLDVGASIGRLHIDTDDALLVGAGRTLGLQGGLLDLRGRLSLVGGSTNAVLSLGADTEVGGGGLLRLDAAGLNAGRISGNGHRLTLAAGQQLSGQGSLINLDLVNRGHIAADAAGVLTLNPGGGHGVDNSQGLIEVGDGAQLMLSTGSLSGGMLLGHGSAAIGGGGVFRDVNLAGTLAVRSGSNLSLAGQVDLHGALALAGGSGYATLNLADDTVLAGAGALLMTATGSNGGRINGYGHRLTLADGQVLAGVGLVGGSMDLVDQGRIAAVGGLLSLNPGAGHSIDARAGELAIGAGATLSLDSGTLLLGDDSRLAITVAGAPGAASFGRLQSAGDLSFDGQLLLDLSDHAAAVGESFALASCAGVCSGSFDSVVARGYDLSLSYGEHELLATVTGLAPVPEPQTVTLLLAGLAVMGFVAGRRRG